MGQRHYLVYEPTPKGGGIPIALFDNIESATLFIQAYCVKYYREAHLCIMQVDVNGKTCLNSYMPNYDEPELENPIGDPYEDAFSDEMGD